ncbi:MobC family plasmid mobilization relaxosome protein [Streptomyces aidingensis]|nr:MobC family plasmid mobilization relaxosome protein [Streptomyces aidingensis]
MNRRRAAEPRTRYRTVRFTPAEDDLIARRAAEAGLSVAGCLGNLGVAWALGNSLTVAGPEDDPQRPVVEAVEAQSAQLRRIGNNVNQIARAVNSGATAALADEVLRELREAIRRNHAVMDGLLAKAVRRGS